MLDTRLKNESEVYPKGVKFQMVLSLFYFYCNCPDYHDVRESFVEGLCPQCDIFLRIKGELNVKV